MIPVILVTGFLGSGKTTFLKQIARKNPHRKFLYIVNDFASMDVDGEWVRRTGAPVMAISGGSIFCRCLVADFIRILRQAVAGDTPLGVPPEAVILEASGMADPRAIRQMLTETKLDGSLAIRRILAVVDPGTVHKLLHTLPAIRAQITCADTALISKADRYPEAEIARTRAAVQAIQPTIRCVSMIQGEADIRVWDEIACPVVEGDYAKCVDPDYFRFVLSDPLPESCARFRGLAEASGEALYRAKGFLREGDRVYAVEWSSSGFRAEEWTGPLPPLGIACIARGEDGARLEALWRTTRNKAGVPTADES